jgi:predicted TIM-barrel fold metal-dependent hydrolase
VARTIAEFEGSNFFTSQAVYRMTREQRLRERPTAPLRWPNASNARDWATAMLPNLLHERLEEFGIDVAIIYPTRGLGGLAIVDPDYRHAFCRAYNKMTAELFAPYRDRLIPVAVVPTNSPQEAIAGAEYAVRELGFRAILISGVVKRPKGPDADPAGRVTGTTPYYIDVLALDSPFDYEPVWQKLEELGVAVATHTGSTGWDGRQSPHNFSFNHIGHFAQANQAFARALMLGGVVWRHPRLRFIFLEGGVAWGCNLLTDLVAHWEKRSREAMLTHYAPSQVDVEEYRRLLRQYGAAALGSHVGEMCADDMLYVHNPQKTLQEVTERETEFDFDLMPAASPAEIREQFARAFFFGCEPDDPMTRLAFDATLLGTRLRPMFGSDISHFDVLDMTEVLEEAYALVERGHVDLQAFRELTFTNVLLAHTSLNRQFFAGTVVEAAVEAELAAVEAAHSRR